MSWNWIDSLHQCLLWHLKDNLDRSLNVFQVNTEIKKYFSVFELSCSTEAAQLAKCEIDAGTNKHFNR